MLALIVSSVLIGFAHGACPTGWEHNNAWCYLISRDNATMPGAVVTCTYLGGTLATIDAAAQTFLAKTMNQSKYSAGDAFWIDGNDQAVEGTFVDNKGQNLTYTDWGPSQPNNQWGQENCIAMRRDFGFGYKWSDDPCGEVLNYVCRRSFRSGAALVG